MKTSTKQITSILICFMLQAVPGAWAFEIPLNQTQAGGLTSPGISIGNRINPNVPINNSQNGSRGELNTVFVPDPNFPRTFPIAINNSQNDSRGGVNTVFVPDPNFPRTFPIAINNDPVAPPTEGAIGGDGVGTGGSGSSGGVGSGGGSGTLPGPQGGGGTMAPTNPSVPQEPNVADNKPDPDYGGGNDDGTHMRYRDDNPNRNYPQSPPRIPGFGSSFPKNELPPTMVSVTPFNADGLRRQIDRLILLNERKGGEEQDEIQFPTQPTVFFTDGPGMPTFVTVPEPGDVPDEKEPQDTAPPTVVTVWEPGDEPEPPDTGQPTFVPVLEPEDEPEDPPVTMTEPEDEPEPQDTPPPTVIYIKVKKTILAKGGDTTTTTNAPGTLVAPLTVVYPKVKKTILVKSSNTTTTTSVPGTRL